MNSIQVAGPDTIVIVDQYSHRVHLCGGDEPNDKQVVQVSP